MAPIAHVLFDKFMKFNPKNPEWLNRDRFVLSYVYPARDASCYPSMRKLLIRGV